MRSVPLFNVGLCGCLAFALAGASAFADDAATPTHQGTSDTATASHQGTDEIGNIHQGNIQVGGTASLSNDQYEGGSATTLTLSPSAQYFLLDDFSLGADFSYVHSFSTNGASTLSVGPAATYYFLAMDRLAPFVSAAALYNWTGYNNHAAKSSSYWSTVGSIGVDYFFTPSVAVGPNFNWTHQFATNGGFAQNFYALGAAFNIYL